MYKKELKKRFMDFVLYQADLVVSGIDKRQSFWACVYYHDALRTAALVMDTSSYLGFLPIVRFKSVFDSICEYRKGVC